VEVVAPTSAPMFAIVASPVHDCEATPGPKYSNIRPVPPYIVNIHHKRDKEDIP
jgi:hypothetical protein